jgi:hypothetical protein
VDGIAGVLSCAAGSLQNAFPRGVPSHLVGNEEDSSGLPDEDERRDHGDERYDERAEP